MDITNDPINAGGLAGEMGFFGPNNRYAVAPIHTRFDEVEWFVWDYNQQTQLPGFPDLIRQATTLELALQGFNTSIEQIWVVDEIFRS